MLHWKKFKLNLNYKSSFQINHRHNTNCLQHIKMIIIFMHILFFFLFEHCHLTSLLDILCLVHVCFFRPVQGLIFLFKWKADDEPQGSVVHDTRRQIIFFAKQVSDISEKHFCPDTDIDLPLVCSQACANIRMIRKYLAMYVTDRQNMSI